MGRYYVADGRKYVGTFEDGKFHGEGTLYPAEGDAGGMKQGPGKWYKGVYDDKDEREKRAKLKDESERRAKELQKAVDAANSGDTPTTKHIVEWEHDHDDTEIQTYVRAHAHARFAVASAKALLGCYRRQCGPGTKAVCLPAIVWPAGPLSPSLFLVRRQVCGRDHHQGRL